MQTKVLWRATRAYSLPASIVPVLLGTVLASHDHAALPGGNFHGGVFVLTLIGAVLAQMGANVLNDYFDFKYGVDTRPEHGSGVITSGQMTAQQALIYAALLLAGAGVCGLFLLGRNPGLVVPLVAVGLACAVLYSALLKKYGLGDLLIMIAFGVGLTVGAYGVQAVNSGFAQWVTVALYSVPVCLLVDAILHANNLRDAADDRSARVHTMATMLPPGGGRLWQRILLFGPLIFVVIGVALRLLPFWSLATLLAFPLLLRADRTGSVEGTAQTHLIFGLIYTASLLA